MKKVLLMMSILLSTSMFYACSSDGEIYVNSGGEMELLPDSTLIPEDGVVLTPIDIYEIYNGVYVNRTWHINRNDELGTISRFFNKELPKGQCSNSIFVDSDHDECYVINSLEELKNIYCGDREIPYIDFEHYTLVIGQIVESGFYYPLLKQDLMFKDNRCHLTLYVPELDEVNLNGDNYKTQYFYHWALYPKFNTEGISVGFIKEGALQFVENVVGGKMKYICDIQRFDPERWHITYFDSDTWLTYCYYPMNLPDDYKEERQLVSFSGYIFDTFDEIGSIGDRYDYYIYLTDIEKVN